MIRKAVEFGNAQILASAKLGNLSGHGFERFISVSGALEFSFLLLR